MPTQKTTIPTHYPADLVARSCMAALEALRQGNTERSRGILEDLAEGIYSYPQAKGARP
jgi:hypothetical protein